jgi:hypothetical protein
MLKLAEEFAFINYRINTFLLNYPTLRHFLHGINSLELLPLYFPYLSKPSLTNDIMEFKVSFVDG